MKFKNRSKGIVHETKREHEETLASTDNGSNCMACIPPFSNFTHFMHLVILSLIWDLNTQMYLTLFKTITFWFQFNIKLCTI